MSVRLAIDIGGTFTDATLIDEETGEVVDREGADDAVRPVGGLHAGRRAGPRRGRRRGGRGHVRRPRDDGGDERDHRGQDRAQRLRHDRRLPRPARDRPPGAADALRHPVREGEAARARATAPSSSASGSARRARCCGRSRTTRCATQRRSSGREGVESVAVCLLHAYVNPEHEQRVGEILAEELPGIPISLSSEVAPEFREYLRASTTVINAVIRPVVERYLQRIESRLAAAGVQAKLLVMQSSGGIFGSDAARRPAGVHGRVGPRRRRDRLGIPRRDARPARTSSRSTWAARRPRSA